MQIQNLRHVNLPPSSTGFQCIAKFTVDFSEHFRVFDWQLIRAPDGRAIAYAPAGKNSPSIIAASPALRNEIADLAYMEYMNSDRDSHAA